MTFDRAVTQGLDGLDSDVPLYAYQCSMRERGQESQNSINFSLSDRRESAKQISVNFFRRHKIIT